jgi:excinuclease ABC subunit C
VAALWFKDGKPSKKDYRHFNIKTVEGPDDFASMTEVVYRRYKGLLKKISPTTNNYDGGKGNSAALKSIDELGLRGKIAVMVLQKTGGVILSWRFGSVIFR